MKITELEATFLKILDERTFRHEGVLISEAQGVMFICPKCYKENGNSKIGVHSCICWFSGKGVPDTMTPLPGRWGVSGTCIEDLTLNPSILITAKCCGWHGFIKNGETTDA